MLISFLGMDAILVDVSPGRVCIGQVSLDVPPGEELSIAHREAVRADDARLERSLVPGAGARRETVLVAGVRGGG